MAGGASLVWVSATTEVVAAVWVSVVADIDTEKLFKVSFVVFLFNFTIHLRINF